MTTGAGSLDNASREFREVTQALSVDALLQAVGYMETDTETSENLEKLTDAALAEGVAMVQDALARLRMVERDLTVALGQRVGKVTANLADGRQFTLARSADRKEWAHDDWKRDVRRTITEEATGTWGSAVDVLGPDGEIQNMDLGRLVQTALTKAQNVHGAQAPKSTALKALGLYASDYCTSTPGGWRFTAISPTTTENSSGEQNDG